MPELGKENTKYIVMHHISILFENIYRVFPIRVWTSDWPEWVRMIENV